jgi:hypothetical protein
LGVKTYVLTTGIVFALIVATHIARVIAEGPGLLKQPVFIFTSILSVGLMIWALRLFVWLRRRAKE